jgi:protein SCO1/2
MMRRPRLLYGLLVALLAAGGALLGVLLTMPEPQQAQQESGSSTAAIGGPFTLVSADGRTVTDQTFRGKWMLIYFGYTFCPDACPTALTNMGVALQKLGPEAARIAPLFITVDPKRDTVKAMAEYLKSFDPRIVGLTGSEAQTGVAAKAYHVYVAPQKSEGDDYLVDHSAYIYLMSPQGKFVTVIAGNIPGDRMADRLRKELARQPA